MTVKEILASQRMTKAWEQMSREEIKRYLNGIDDNRLRQLRKGATPEQGEKNIADYLLALEDYLSSIKSKNLST